MADKRNTYLPGYRTSHVQHHEWRTAENSAAYLLPTLKSLAEQNPQLSLLDVGAGSGTISTSLAKYMPEGRLTATDLSDTILERARDLAKSANATNMTFQQANAYELPFPDDSFDVTHTHQMLAHLGAPVDALRELLRVTKPGGIVAVRETDMQMWCQWPDLPGLKRSVEVIHQTHEASGGSTTAGRQLLPWALEAGAKRENITQTYGTWCFSAPEDKIPFGKLPFLAENAHLKG